MHTDTVIGSVGPPRLPGATSMQRMNSNAKFLVLLDSASSACRALLFDADQHFVGEVIEDDGFIVDNLMRCATACEPPAASSLSELAQVPAQASLRCFQLN